MGAVISTHLDESRRLYISEKTGKVLGEFCQFYEDQYGVALFNSIRYEIEGNGGPQSQLLHRKVPLEDRIILSGNLFQYVEENKKWRNRFCVVPHNYGLVLYENTLAYDRGIQPRVALNSAGYKILTSLDQYLDLVNSSLPGTAPKSSNAPILKCPTQFPLILWHPYSRHYYFCVMTGKEQDKWRAVFQDCVRHCNNGIPEDSTVEAPAFTDAIRMYRQSKEQYGTWDMLCGNEVQVLSNLVMEELVPELKNTIGPKLKGKAQERQRLWIQISDAVYRLISDQIKAHYDAMVTKCELERPRMESTIRTDMDQIITSKEHLASKIRAFVLPKAEICVRNHVQPYIPSILEALMTPTSQGFAEVREVFFKEVTDMNMNVINESGMESLGEHMEKLSQLAFHPVKMQSCYEKMDQLKLEGLQQRFDVSSASVFKQRAQILMREQMDDAVHTFGTLLHQELGKMLGKEELCKSIQRILERVLKKYDYDSSTVRKKFFREALLQITVPFLLKKLAPTCKGELPKFQELIFEDFDSFILVENTYEEVVLQSVMKDIMQAVKEAAVQRKHNLYRDSMVMHNSDPNLHLLGEGTPIDWGEEFGSQPDSDPATEKRRRAKQVVSVIHDDEGALPYEAGAGVLMHQVSQEEPDSEEPETCLALAAPGSPDDVQEIRGMLVQEVRVETRVLAGEEAKEQLTNGTIVQLSAGSEVCGAEEAAPSAEEGPAPLEHSARPDAGSLYPVNPEVEEQEAKPAVLASPAVPPALAAAPGLAEEGAEVNRHEPNDKETGEEVTSQGQAEKGEPAQLAPESGAGAPESGAGAPENSQGTTESGVGAPESSKGTTESSEGLQTQF
ncbi:protein Niban 2 [Pelodiscus sinensis]|uniref:protein Niban 2 n=1 Tax=Pelodiscus sinensis TaxID=13735 RepID=UPI003F6CAD95